VLTPARSARMIPDDTVESIDMEGSGIMQTMARAFSSDDDRWAAVVRRDPGADGAFFYSVRTTGVYCRPSCASRRARRENVRFHPTREAAERAGFRPCKRCRPDQPALVERRAAAVAKACRLIETAEEVPSLDVLARAAGMSRYHFHRVFTAITGVTPKAYAAAHRARRVRDRLVRGDTVTKAMYDAGFNSSGPFYATAPAVLGMTPTSFRSGGAGTSIRFAVGECSLGSTLVAATDRGMCAILLGDDPEKLVRNLQDQSPKARLIGGDAEFEHVVARVVGLVETPGVGLDLQLDVRGTAFQQRVWQALRAVPPAQTTTYSDLAARLGTPRAVRAVAAACASKPIAIAIPCHRVVRADDDVAGYRWGIERKRTLLAREAAMAKTVPGHPGQSSRPAGHGPASLHRRGCYCPRGATRRRGARGWRRARRAPDLPGLDRQHVLGRLAAPESVAAAIAGVFDPGQARSRARCGLGSVRTRSAT
jgi:AraC family transcriptional regulator of adaptative response/methylated-DNA-[protein]-cysteine methyltransferase